MKNVVSPKPRQRAPKGYRIHRWADGFYHVYVIQGKTQSILDEVLSHKEAIELCRKHKEGNK